MPDRRSRIVMLVIVAIVGCRTQSNNYPRLASADHDVLTREELANVVGTTQNAYSAVERLRPLFLMTRPGFGTTNQTSPRLYLFINGSFAGEAGLLKTIPLASVESIRRAQATTAFTQLGEIHSGDGVLLVRLRR